MAASLGLPLILLTAYAVHFGKLPLVSAEAAAPAAKRVTIASTMPTPYFATPMQQAVWSDGVKAVRQALGEPAYAGFQGSFVSRATGDVVSLCGQVAGTSGYDGANGEQRFISVFGQAAATTLEGSDPSFGVLWNRVCGGVASPA